MSSVVQTSVADSNIDFKKRSPRDLFNKFLSTAQDQMWVDSFEWRPFEDFSEYRKSMQARPISRTHSRTHKRATDGTLWVLDVEGFEGASIGVDLEFICERPILKRPEWLIERLALRKNPGSAGLLEEWSQREAAFKALWPNNEKVLLSSFRRTGQHSLGVDFVTGQQNIQVKSIVAENWILSLAWCLDKT